MAHIKVSRRNLSFQQWAEVNFGRYKSFVIEDFFPVSGWKVREGEYSPDGYLWDAESRPITEGEPWGGPDVTAWFEVVTVLPDELAGREVFFMMDTPTEVMVSSDNHYIGGLDPNRSRFKLEKKAPKGKKYHFSMEAYTRSKPDDDRNPQVAKKRGCIQFFSQPAFVTINDAVQNLVYDLDILIQTAYAPAVDEDVRDYLENKIKKMLPFFPPHDASKADFLAALPRIRDYLSSQVYDTEHPFAKTGKLACVAHSHLDIAYYWRARQTVQKNARTVLIQLKLMEEYPWFTYAHTQAWTYEMLEKYYPELFEEVREKVKSGQWEIAGGMYVEPDCNVVSAESLIRQFLYGKLYFKEKFDIDVDNCWLPDVFGNSAVLPQIMKKCGVPYFVSNKMSTWNDTNRFPHNHFLWEGTDGSRVAACVPPVHFITWMDPNQAAEHWEALQDKEIVDESLQMFGYGDGGSGVTEEMLEYYKRQEKLPGIPRQRMTSGKEFLKSAFDGKDDLAVWKGDLYLEMHRGTFTNKGILKKLNRKGEFALQEAETLAALASFSGYAYPGGDFREAWKILLANQFHDTLPGTHVMLVTRDTLNEYEKMFAILDKVMEESRGFLLEKKRREITIINPCSWPRTALAELPEEIDDNSLAGMEYQLFHNPDGSSLRKTLVMVNAFSSVDLLQSSLSAGYHKSGELAAAPDFLESPFYRIDFDRCGEITGIFDKERKRQIARKDQPLNQWQIFEDAPGRYNAWDIVDRFEDKPLDAGVWENISVIEEGPLCAALRMERRFLNSRAVQIIRVYRDHRRVDFQTWVDWDERERLLKVAFPTNLYADYYSCDNSAGVSRYENHRNTSWQQARFEVPFHKWVDISEGLFGVSLMSDCKYGCDVKGGQLRMSLLRGSIRPDLYSDKGVHEFTYSLTSHGGQWQNSPLLDEAYELNFPLKAVKGGLPETSVIRNGVISLEGREGNSCTLRGQALKLAEDGSGDLIFRFTEYSGTGTSAVLKLNFPFKQCEYCNMLEETTDLPECKGNRIVLYASPFEIITLRIKR